MRFALVVTTCAACATAPANPCSMATDHVAACTSEAPAFRTGACDERLADELLALDCSDLRDLASTARADGWWDAFLCSLQFADHCGAPSLDSHTLVGTIHRLDGSPAVAVYVRVLEDGKPETARGSWTFAGGLFAFADLANAHYRLEVALAPTAATLYARALEADTFVSLDAPIPPE
jgi:hypothetical protein